MEKLGVKKSGVLAVLLIVLFVTSVFSVFSVTTNAALFNRYDTVRIGVIAPIDDYLDPVTALYKTIVENDINAYVAKLPVSRFVLPVKFDFVVVGGGDGTPGKFYEKVVMLHKMGIDLIIGGWISDQIGQNTLDYLKKNNMVMISPGSNAHTLAKVDNLFRLLPDASIEGSIVAAMFEKLGLTKAIVFERTDDWGKGVYQSFTSSYSGSVATYPFSAGDTAGFTNDLIAANTGADGQSKVGVFLIALDTDCAGQLNRDDFAFAYSNLGGIPWFGADGTAFSTNLTGKNVGVLKILSPNPATPHNQKFDDMNTRYTPILGPMDYSGGCNIDAGWILAQAVIETRSTVFFKSPGATDVIKVLSDDCSRYFGYSGWCQLDKNGDRVSGNWDIVGYGLDAYNNLVILQYGSYDAYSGVSWIATPGWP